MSLAKLRTLCSEMREALIQKLSVHGGHVGPNLGMVEAIVALHYVFNAPEDKLVFDVSHQTYSHKMLTGRREAFTDPAHYDDVTGFTEPKESPYDLFAIGHTSTSLSLATGLVKARDIKGGKENVVAVIGDGSLSGGMAFEGLNIGATMGSNFIVVVNDNDMSIAENHGGLYADLRLLRNTNGEGQPNFFRSMGYSYRYVHYGNDLRSLIEAFKAVKDIDHPVVVHINTMKGMGLPVAEAHKEQFHFTGPFDPATGAPANPAPKTVPASYGEAFAEHMLELAQENPELVVLTAGTPGAIDFTPERRKILGKRFVDVAIAEQDAVGMAAGMAKGGLRPVFGVVSTFLQRAYDQLSHDVAINNLPAVFCIAYGSVWGMNDQTHLGFFDMAMAANIPNINFLAPTCLTEYYAMMNWAVKQQEQPVIVRLPGGPVVEDYGVELLSDYSRPQWETVVAGGKVAIIAAGSFMGIGRKAVDILKDKGCEVTLINPRCVSALDMDAIEGLREYEHVITLEDGIIDGGFGQKVAGALASSGTRVSVLGLPKEFPDRYNAAELLDRQGITPEKVAALAMS